MVLQLNVAEDGTLLKVSDLDLRRTAKPGFPSMHRFADQQTLEQAYRLHVEMRKELAQQGPRSKVVPVSDSLA